MAKERTGMVFYFDQIEIFKKLKAEDAITLLFAMVAFSKDGIVPDFKDNMALDLLWPAISPRLANDKDKYEEKRLINSVAGQNSALKKELEKLKQNEEELLKHRDDFKTIFEIYPKKEGEAQAFDEYLTWIVGRIILGKKEKLINKEVWNAVKYYIYLQEQEGTELKFYKNFASLLGPGLWDYVQAYKNS